MEAEADPGERSANVRDAACVILMRRNGAERPLEVFLVKRSEALSFLGGFHAFPGGAVDEVDSTLVVHDAPCDPVACSTAVRELFEEVGVLATAGADKLTATARREARERLLQCPRSWPDLLSHHGLRLDGSALIPVAHWVTPPFSPIRFRAPYLALWLPEGQEPEIWPGELSDGVWITPEEAVHRHVQGELFITYPVLETLRELAAHAGDLTAAARALDASGRNHQRLEGGEMITGVHLVPVRSPTHPPATHTNCYVLGRRELVVVDPGTPVRQEQDRLVGYLEHLLDDGCVLREIWLTHHHPDHTAAAKRLRDRFGVPLAAHRLTAAALAADSPQALTADRLIPDGDVTELASEPAPPARWVALHTPGHAPGHLCFFEERLGTLLSGDNVLGLGTPLVAPPEGNMADYMASLRRLIGLRLGMLFPAHGPPRANAAAKVTETLEHRAWRERRILDALAAAAGPATPAEIVSCAYSDVSETLYPLAEQSVRAHLQKLLDDGLVRTEQGRFVQI